MNMLGKVLKLLIEIREQDLGTIHDLLERMVAQQNRGVSIILGELKSFLRKDGFASMIVDGQSDSVFESDRFIYHQLYPNFEFNELEFELVKIESPSTGFDFLRILINAGYTPVNSNFMRFLKCRTGIFPEAWKHKKILLLGTNVKEHDPNKKWTDLRPIAFAFSYDLKIPFHVRENKGFHTCYIYLDEVITPSEDVFALCLKRPLVRD